MDQHTIAIHLAVVEAHGGSEAAGRVDEAVALDPDAIVWEAPSRPLRLQGQEAVAANDRQIFRTIKHIHWHGLEGTGSETCHSHARATGLEAGSTRGGVGRRLW